MAEPNVTIAAGGFAGAGISSVTIILGAHADALAIGALAAIFVSIWMQTIDSRLKAAGAVLFSSMLAGYGSPVAAGLLLSRAPDLVGGDPLRLLLALVIGAATPSVFPLVLSRFGKTVGECKI